MMRVALLSKALDAGGEYAAFLSERTAAGATDGAVASMVGLVRATAKDGSALTELTLEHYRGATITSMQGIADDAAQRFALSDLLLLHRTGTMVPGDAIVLVAAAATHRRAAFDAVDYMMDRLKSEAVFWKRERGADGQSQWIEPTLQDNIDAQRWIENGS